MHNSTVTYWEKSQTTRRTFIIFFVILFVILLLCYILRFFLHNRKKIIIIADFIEIPTAELFNLPHYGLVDISEIELYDASLPKAILIDSSTP